MYKDQDYKETVIVKTLISNAVRATRVWNNLHQVRSQTKAK